MRNMLWKELVPVLSPSSLLPSWNFFQNALVRGLPMATSQVCVFSLFDTINILWLKLLPWNIGLLGSYLTFLVLFYSWAVNMVQITVNSWFLDPCCTWLTGLTWVSPVHLNLTQDKVRLVFSFPRHLSCTMTFMLYLSQWHNSSPQLPAHAGGESCNSVSQPWFHVLFSFDTFHRTPYAVTRLFSPKHSTSCHFSA